MNPSRSQNREDLPVATTELGSRGKERREGKVKKKK